MYRLTALPVGTYDVTAELQGFAKVARNEIVGQCRPDTRCRVDDGRRGNIRELTVTGGTPLIETRSSSVGGVVDIARIENLPLNGRQFANLAATVPGVGLGYHSDPTKSTQFSPQIAGGNGRNVNYLVDGGDNNDDTVGGLLQLFPLEAIQEFNFITQRYKAEYGRSNGGVHEHRHEERHQQQQRQCVRPLSRQVAERASPTRNRRRTGRRPTTGATSSAARSAVRFVQDRAFYFVAAERTQQDTNQAVKTLGLFPDRDGVYPTPVSREPDHRQADDDPRARRNICRFVTAATATRHRFQRRCGTRRVSGARAGTRSIR